MPMKILAMCAALALLIGAGFAAICAEKAYDTSCMKCSFDTNGKMDKACYEDQQNKGVLCLFAAYPMESIQYKAGDCPAIQACVDRLETCKALYTTGNDATDCHDEMLSHCFIRGDRCVAEAAKNCKEPPPNNFSDVAPPPGWCDAIFFMFTVPFLGVVAYWQGRGKK